MAQRIIDNIEYDDVNTVDDIKRYQKNTKDIIYLIENTDMVQLNNVYNTKMRFIQSDESVFPQNPKQGMGIFITSSDN